MTNKNNKTKTTQLNKTKNAKPNQPKKKTIEKKINRQDQQNNNLYHKNHNKKN